jgi:hypothetical protein
MRTLKDFQLRMAPIPHNESLPMLTRASSSDLPSRRPSRSIFFQRNFFQQHNSEAKHATELLPSPGRPARIPQRPLPLAAPPSLLPRLALSKNSPPIALRTQSPPLGRTRTPIQPLSIPRRRDAPQPRPSRSSTNSARSDLKP